MCVSFIKIQSDFPEWEWFDDGDILKVYMYLLCKASYKDKAWRGMLVKRGELRTSLSSLSERLNLSSQKVRTILKKLESSKQIVVKSTNRFSIITVCNYDNYNGTITSEQQTNNKQITIKQQASNNQTTSEQQTNNKQITTSIENIEYSLPPSPKGDTPAQPENFVFFENLDENLVSFAGDEVSTSAKTENDSEKIFLRADFSQKTDPEKTPKIAAVDSKNDKIINFDAKTAKKAEKTAKTIKKFIPPTLDEVKKYAEERILQKKPFVPVEKFFNYYTANGWVQGKGKPIKDWKAAYRTWEGNSYSVKSTSATGVYTKLPTAADF